MSTAIKHPVPDRVKPAFVIFDRAECQNALMSKFTRSLTRSGTGCFRAVSMWQQRASEG